LISKRRRPRLPNSGVRGALAGLWWWIALLLPAGAAERLPPKPAQYFNDYAGVVSAAAARLVEGQLRQFERDTSNQIVVAIFPRMEARSSVQEFTHRVAESWRVGQPGRDNGAVLFVFIAERQMFIQVGYGLEGALPDLTAKRIVENEIRPAFRAGDFDRGVTAGVAAMIAATRGEYRGTGRVAGDAPRGSPGWGLALLALALLIVALHVVRTARRGVVYTRRGRRYTDDAWPTITTGGGGWSGGSGWSGGGGGGFSGGGGSFGGGGAGESW
jgi:uncharacterized protein